MVFYFIPRLQKFYSNDSKQKILQIAINKSIDSAREKLTKRFKDALNSVTLKDEKSTLLRIYAAINLFGGYIEIILQKDDTSELDFIEIGLASLYIYPDENKQIGVLKEKLSIEVINTVFNTYNPLHVLIEDFGKLLQKSSKNKSKGEQFETLFISSLCYLCSKTDLTVAGLFEKILDIDKKNNKKRPNSSTRIPKWAYKAKLNISSVLSVENSNITKLIIDEFDYVKQVLEKKK